MLKFSMMPTCLSAACAVCMLYGCKTYEPKPVPLEDQHQAWRLSSQEVAQQYAQLSLADAQAIALQRHPALLEAYARLQVSEASLRHAGLWDDPSIDIAVLDSNQGQPELIEGGFGLTLPTSGRLPIEREQARAISEHDKAQLADVQRQVLADLFDAWMDYKALLQSTDLKRAHITQLQTISTQLAALAESGETEPLLAESLRLQAAQLNAKIAASEMQSRSMRRQLAQHMGLQSDVFINMRPQLNFDLLQPAPLHFNAQVFAPSIDATHTTLAVAQANYAEAEANVAREIAKQRPDVSVGAPFESEGGQSKVGIGVGLPIPAWNRNQQGIAVAEAEREVAALQLQHAMQALDDQLSHLADQAHQASHATAQQQGVVEAAQALMLRQQKLIEAGEASPVSVLKTLDTLLEARLEQHAQQSAYDKTAAHYAALVAGDAPRAKP